MATGALLGAGAIVEELYNENKSKQDSDKNCPLDSNDGFDPNNKKDQRDKDWHYHWDKNPHDKRGGQPHWDRGHLRDGSRQEWSPDGVNWYSK